MSYGKVDIVKTLCKVSSHTTKRPLKNSCKIFADYNANSRKDDDCMK